MQTRRGQLKLEISVSWGRLSKSAGLTVRSRLAVISSHEIRLETFQLLASLFAKSVAVSDLSLVL